MLEILPAIDLLNGQAVRLKRGDYATSERVADDPVKVAQGFAADGATCLHIVDLDGARTGDGVNLPVIAAIIRAVPGLRVQVGGGVRTVGRLEQVLNAGAARVIVGTTAASDDAVIGAMLAKYAAQVIVGADTKNGYVAVHGWEQASAERTTDFGKRLADMGAARFLYTDVARDGMLQGVDADGTAALATATGKPVIASGGVATLADIEACARLQPLGVEGVIIGKALYAGRFTVADAVRVARSAAS